MQELQLLKDRLDVLLRKYTAVEAENIRLKNTVTGQLKFIESLNHKLTSLEENMLAHQIGKSVPGAGDKEKMRRQIDNVISEIDKIMNTLND
jgi:hypothetical protein